MSAPNLSGAANAAANTQTVFVYSETMLAKLRTQPGASADGKISAAVIKQGDEEKVMYFTHEGRANEQDSDAKAVENAMGASADFWADTCLKVVRVNPDDVVSRDRDLPADKLGLPHIQTTYYNYSEENILRAGSIPKEPKFDVAPSEGTTRPTVQYCENQHLRP